MTKVDLRRAQSETDKGAMLVVDLNLDSGHLHQQLWAWIPLVIGQERTFAVKEDPAEAGSRFTDSPAVN